MTADAAVRYSCACTSTTGPLPAATAGTARVRALSGALAAMAGNDLLHFDLDYLLIVIPDLDQPCPTCPTTIVTVTAGDWPRSADPAVTATITAALAKLGDGTFDGDPLPAPHIGEHYCLDGVADVENGTLTWWWRLRWKDALLEVPAPTFDRYRRAHWLALLAHPTTANALDLLVDLATATPDLDLAEALDALLGALT